MSAVSAMPGRGSHLSRTPLRYLLSVGLNLVAMLVGLCAITCGVYMIERTVGILEIALRYQFSLGSFVGLVILQLPTLAEFALPVASYAAVHLVLLARRERREFVTLAAAGVSTAGLVVPVVFAVVASALLSVAFTDTIAPAATRAYRLIEAAARAQVLARRLPESRFYTGADSVLYIGKAGQSGSTLRLFQFNKGQIASILSSDCVSPQTSETRILLRLCDGEAYLFNRPLETGIAPARVQMGETVYPFDAASVLGARSSSRLPTLSVGELLRSRGGGDVEDRAEGISRLLSALACLVAASLAILSVAYTSTHTRVVTFIGGSVTMFSLMALRDPLALFLARSDPSHLPAMGMAFAAAALLLPGLIARQLDGKLVAPAMVKT